MKILFISQFAGSAHHGMVTRNYNWGVELTRLGHDVTIIASAYSHYRNKHPDMGNQSLKREMIDGIRYLWLRSDIYDGNSSLGRIKSMFTFHRRLTSVISRLNHGYDLVIASSPQPFVIYPARTIARKNNAKLVYDIRDLWPLTLKEIGDVSKWNPFIMALQHAEDYACRHADLVTAVPQNSKGYLIKHGMRADKFLHIGNGAIIQESAIQSTLPDAYSSRISQLKKDGKFLIGYAGTLGRANALHAAINALQLADKNIHFIIIGRGNEEAKLKHHVTEQKLQDRVDFLPPVEQNQVPHFLKMIDVAYIGLTDSPLFQYGASPAKINDYMMAQRPIIYAIGDPNSCVELSGGGINCRAENSAEIATAMNKLYAMDKSDLVTLGQKGKEWLLQNQLISVQVKRVLDKLAVHLPKSSSRCPHKEDEI